MSVALSRRCPTWACGHMRLLIIAMVCACTSRTLPSSPPVPTNAATPVTQLAGTRALNGAFPTATQCALCHSNTANGTAMRDAAGRAIAPWDLWRATMMANAARDPIFRAQLQLETQRAPTAAAAIEATCLRCHAPMLTQQRHAAGQAAPRLAELSTNSDDAIAGLDSVNCTTCHRMASDRLGTEASFDGNFAFGPRGRMYGPYPAPFAGPMMQHLGVMPEPAAHYRQSDMCGSCHTLVTHALNPDGTPRGRTFDEQTPYLDYLASDYAKRGVTCQTCHMPATDEDGNAIATWIARRPDGGIFGPTSKRTPYGRHVFVGANTLVPAMLRDEAVLGAVAPAEAFSATIQAAQAMLAQAAAITIGNVSIDGTSRHQRVAVTVSSRTGHKLPAGYPARRMFLHVRFTDDKGNTIFESGRTNLHGDLIDHTGAVLASEAPNQPFAPHRDVIAASTDVQIWEQVPGDAQSQPTTSLLAAEQMLKDNRILPTGVVATSPAGQRIAPVGTHGDPNFVPGSDTVTFDLGEQTPARVEVNLMYQTLSPRWRQSLQRSATPWGKALMDMLVRNPAQPVAVARAIREF